MDVTVMMIPIVLFISMTIMIVFIRKFTNDERMALIEKGGDANIFNRQNSAYPNLRYGLLLVGAGLGLLVGSYLERTTYMQEEAYFAMLFIFGGIGLFVSYFIEKKAEQSEHKD